MFLDELQMIKREIASAAGMTFLVVALGFTELIISVNEYGRVQINKKKAEKQKWS